MPGGLHLRRVLLVEVAQRDDVLVAEERVVVEVDLGVEGQHAAVARHDQRIDLGERGVGLPEGPVEPLQKAARLAGERFRHADQAGELDGVGLAQAGFGVDADLVDLLRRARRHLLDLGAALGARHDGDALRAAVDDEADVELVADVGALLDQQPLHQLPLRSRLVRDEGHAEDGRGVLTHLLEGAGELDAAPLAAPAGVDLRLDHPHVAAELLRRGDGLVHAEARLAARRGDAVAAQQLLGLVFVNLHASPLIGFRRFRRAGPGVLCRLAGCRSSPAKISIRGRRASAVRLRSARPRPRRAPPVRCAR